VLPANVPAHPGGRGAAAEEAARRAAATVSEPAAERPRAAVDFREWLRVTGATPRPLPPIPVASRARTSGHDEPPPHSSSRSLAKWLVPLLILLLVVAAVLALTIDRRSHGTGSIEPATSPPVTISVVRPSVTTPPPTTPPPVRTTVASIGTTTATTTATTAAPATSTTVQATTTTVPPTTEPPIPPTPAAVTAPGVRAGAGSPCTLDAEGISTPTERCYVPLINGNVLVWANGNLVCADPAAQAVAPAATFQLGVGGDPLAMIADGGLVPKCDDLTYARNVMTGGLAEFPGLCGSTEATIDPTTVRCFAQNPASGAMLAVVQGADGRSITATCFGSGGVAPIELPWSKPTVDAGWKVEGVSLSDDQSSFVVVASKGPESAFTGAACA
jgi:hypothetical protein